MSLKELKAECIKEAKESIKWLYESNEMKWGIIIGLFGYCMVLTSWVYTDNWNQGNELRDLRRDVEILKGVTPIEGGWDSLWGQVSIRELKNESIRYFGGPVKETFDISNITVREVPKIIGTDIPIDGSPVLKRSEDFYG